MFDHRETGDEILLSARWSPATRWFLDQHRTRAGEALLPGTGYAGMMAELAGPGGFVPFGMRRREPFRYVCSCICQQLAHAAGR